MDPPKFKLALLLDDPLLSRELADILGNSHMVRDLTLAHAFQFNEPDEITIVSHEKLRQFPKTELHDEKTIVLGGANNEYSHQLQKPFRFTDLKQLLSNIESDTPDLYSVGNWLLDPATRILEAPEKPKIRLTEKEYQILEFLIRNKGTEVPRENLLQSVWGYNPTITTHTLETYIYRLRKKIEVDASRPTLLLTCSTGYQLV